MTKLGLDAVRMSTARPPRVVSRSVRPGSVARREALKGWWRTAMPWLVLLVVTMCWDRAVYVHVRVADEAAAEAMKGAGWYLALRSLGELYLWSGLAAVFLLLDLDGPSRGTGRRNPLRRAVFMILPPVLAGGVAEVMKPLVGRFKPEETDGWYAIAGVRERFAEWSDLGMASSHTAVAFGAAFALSRIAPRGAPLYIAGALGCAMSRLLAGGHFLSDVYVGIVIAYVVTQILHAIDLRNNNGVPISG